VVVDLETAARECSDLQVEASLQLSIYGYATATNGLADEADLRLRLDVLTRTKTPELHRYRTTRDRAANVRFYRLAVDVLAAVEAGVFPPRVSWQRQDRPVLEPVLGVGRVTWAAAHCDTRTRTIPRRRRPRPVTLVAGGTPS
jgi:hypothetical protein